MDRQRAEHTVTEYIKPIFGFALKRCKTIEDAEDLSQEIVLRAFRALLLKEDIEDVSKFIWTIAHNALNNYYRDRARAVVGIPIDEITETVADPGMLTENGDNRDTLHRLQSEIAYLSKLQRQIVIAYYFENRKQADIAKSLGIPLGTVKWHLFEAKKELKRGIDMTRRASDLKFNPIKFDSYSINGSIGKKSLEEFFRSSLAQNICYCVRSTAKTVNEIADDLGVSPVYVESEAEFLKEYSFLQMQKDKYIANFIISEPTAEDLVMQDTMYKRAASLFANDLHDELLTSGILDDPGIICHQTDEPLSLTTTQKADRNFLLWSLIPYIAAQSGKGLMEENIKFEEVATVRPDGAHNIAHASLMPDTLILPEDYVRMNKWCGPMWNQIDNGSMHWQIDSAWSDRGNESPVNQAYNEKICRILSLYASEEDGLLSKNEYTWLAQQGYVKTCGDYDGHFKTAWQIVVLTNRTIRDRLLAIGTRIKEKYKAEFDAIKAPYVQAVLHSVPPHLRRVREYELQFIFHADGLFLLHCIVCLLQNGKLKEPTEGQRKSLSTMIIR